MILDIIIIIFDIKYSSFRKRNKNLGQRCSKITKYKVFFNIIYDGTNSTYGSSITYFLRGERNRLRKKALFWLK